MSSKDDCVGLQVLQRLFDQRSERRRGDLELHAGLLLELRQQVGERAMVVLVAGHQDVDLRAGDISSGRRPRTREVGAEADEGRRKRRRARALQQAPAADARSLQKHAVVSRSPMNSSLIARL